MINRILHKTILLAAVASCFFLFACENSKAEIEALTEKKVMVDEAYDIESYLSQNGKLKAKLTAPLMMRYSGLDSPRLEFPKSLHCDFFNDSAVIETILDSKFGIYYESLNKVYIWDSVLVVSMKGDTLKAQDLWWDQNTKLFYTEKPATYSQNGGNVLYPQHGLEATQDFKRITFREVDGYLLMPNEGMNKTEQNNL